MSNNEIAEIVNYCILGAFGFVALIGFIRGLVKGAFRSLSDVVFVLINALASTFIAKWIVNTVLDVGRIIDFLYELEESIPSQAYSEFLVSIEPYVQEGTVLREWDFGYILALPAIILAPIVFMLVFMLLGIVFKIVKAILQKLLIPKTKNGGLRFVGGLLGIVRCVLALAIFIVPIVGFGYYAYDATEQYVETTQQQVFDENTEELISNTLNTPALTTISNYGGKWLFENLTTTQVHDVRVSLTVETGHIIEIYSHIPGLTEIGVNGVENITDEQIKQIEETIFSLEKSQYLTSLIASIMAQASTELYVKGEIYTFKLPYFGDTFDPVVDKLLEIWSTTDGNALTDDLNTYVKIFDHLLDQKLFSKIGNSEELMLLLEDGNFYSGILIPLHENLRTRPVVPSVADAMQSYLYEVYEKVNGVPYGDGEIIKVNMDKVDAANMTTEANRIADAIREIHTFVNTIAELERLEDIVKKGDFAALGRGLNQIRDSLFFANAYHFMLDTLLNSQVCADLGIFDSKFIENATRPDADMEKLLLSRQNITILTMAMWDHDKATQEESLKVLIEEITQDDEEALKELVTIENLGKYGIDGEQAETISGMVNSLIDTIHTHEFADENERHEEAENAAHILTMLNAAHINDDPSITNVFKNEANEPSKVEETANQMVEKMLDSEIIMEMVSSAAQSEDLDPYNVQKFLTESDKSGLEQALTNHYGNASTMEDKGSIEELASVFGFDSSMFE